MRSPSLAAAEQDRTLDRVSWSSFISISNSLPERAGLRLIDNKGRLTGLTASRQRVWFAGRLGNLVTAVADARGMCWETAGSATLRLSHSNAGAEGDRTDSLGTRAQGMLGSVKIDLTSQPPPDLAIEVEILDPADEAVAAWGRLGVPEVWRCDRIEWSFGVWPRRQDGTGTRPAGGGRPELSGVRDASRLARPSGLATPEIRREGGDDTSNRRAPSLAASFPDARSRRCRRSNAARDRNRRGSMVLSTIRVVPRDPSPQARRAGKRWLTG